MCHSSVNPPPTPQFAVASLFPAECFLPLVPWFPWPLSLSTRVLRVFRSHLSLLECKMHKDKDFCFVHCCTSSPENCANIWRVLS